MFALRFDILPTRGINRNATQLAVPPSLTLRAYDFPGGEIALDLPGVFWETPALAGAGARTVHHFYCRGTNE